MLYRNNDLYEDKKTLAPGHKKWEPASHCFCDEMSAEPLVGRVLGIEVSLSVSFVSPEIRHFQVETPTFRRDVTSFRK